MFEPWCKRKYENYSTTRIKTHFINYARHLFYILKQKLLGIVNNVKSGFWEFLFLFNEGNSTVFFLLLSLYYLDHRNHPPCLKKTVLLLIDLDVGGSVRSTIHTVSSTNSDLRFRSFRTRIFSKAVDFYSQMPSRSSEYILAVIIPRKPLSGIVLSVFGALWFRVP